MVNVINFQSVTSTDADSSNSIEISGGGTSSLGEYYQKSKIVLKNVLNIFGSIVIISYLLSTPHCMLKEDVGRVHLTSALLAGAGIAYIFLEIVSRKLIINGAYRLGYITCILVLLDQKQKQCPGAGDMFAMGPHQRTQEWIFRVQVVQGAVIVACITQILFGTIGIVRLARYIRPVSIAPMMLLIGVSVIRTTAVEMANTCLVLFSATSLFMFLTYFAYYHFRNKKNESGNKIPNIRRSLHIGVVSALIVWTLCIFLTLMGFVENESPARVDVYNDALVSRFSTPRLSYFFQWGKPKWELDAIFLLLPACFISMCEILANYHISLGSDRHRGIVNKTGKLSGTTWSSIIVWEAAFSLLNITMGTALGIAITFKKRNQEYVGFFVGIILLLIALSGQLCSLFVIVPESIISALIFLSFMSMFLEGLNVITQCINLASRKNLYMLGCSLFLGVVIPALVEDESLHITGRPVFDDVCLSLLSIDFLVAGAVAFILDNLTRAFTPQKLILPTSAELQKPIDQKDERRKSVHLCDCFISLFS